MWHKYNYWVKYNPMIYRKKVSYFSIFRPPPFASPPLRVTVGTTGWDRTASMAPARSGNPHMNTFLGTVIYHIFLADQFQIKL